MTISAPDPDPDELARMTREERQALGLGPHVERLARFLRSSAWRKTRNGWTYTAGSVPVSLVAVRAGGGLAWYIGANERLHGPFATEYQAKAAAWRLFFANNSPTFARMNRRDRRARKRKERR